MNAKTIRIGLAWHSPNSGNLGVGALTFANIAIAREAAAAAGLTPKFQILGFVDQGAPIYVQAPDIEVTPLNTKAMVPGGKYWRALKGLDCVLDIGGGDSFTDIYGPKRFAFLFGSKLLAIWRGKPLVLSPQTIGPFTRQPQSWLAGWAMQKAAAVVARDPVSFELARAMAPHSRIEASVDVAFRLPYDAPVSRSGVGINVSGLLFNGGYSGSNEFGMEIDYAAFSRALIRHFLSAGEAVHLIAHVNSDTLPNDDDRRVADQLLAEFPDCVRAPNFASPSAAKSYIATLDFLVAGRMHACIAAYSSGVPVIPVAYSRKFSGLFEKNLGYPYLLPVRGVDTESAVTFVINCWEHRNAIAQEIETGMKNVDRKLDEYRSLLTDFLRNTVSQD